MRGRRERQAEMLLGVTADALVPADHPIRRVRAIVDNVLARMNDQSWLGAALPCGCAIVTCPQLTCDVNRLGFAATTVCG